MGEPIPSRTVTKRVWFKPLIQSLWYHFVLKLFTNDTNRMSSIHLTVNSRKVFCYWHRCKKISLLEFGWIFWRLCKQCSSFVFTMDMGGIQARNKRSALENTSWRTRIAVNCELNYFELFTLAVHPDYRDVQQLLESSDTWPKQIEQSSKNMIQAGFLYRLKWCALLCFIYWIVEGGQWTSPNTNPISKHYRRDPSCIYAASKLFGINLSHARAVIKAED